MNSTVLLAQAAISLTLVTAPAYAREPVDLTSLAKAAMNGFLSRVPDRLADGRYLTYFSGEVLPTPSMRHDTWDWGDCTSRAVTSWQFVRAMTGDATTGKEVEDGQLALLLSAIDPKLGLVCVPAKSDPDKGVYYFHMWDQGRAITALAQEWTARPEKRPLLTPVLDKMVEGLAKLATIAGVDEQWGAYRRCPGMAYMNADQVSDGDWGSLAAPLTIQGLVIYGETSGKARPIKLAEEFAAGVLADHGSDLGRRFDDDGAISGHYHSGAASAVGIAMLGRYLMTHGDRRTGARMLMAARKTYDWIFAADNPSRGSRMGWIPEHRRPGSIRVYGEICGTADVVELAAVLADSSRLDPRFAGWTDAYDDIAAMSVNTLARSQFRSSDRRYLSLLSKATTRVDSLRTAYTSLKLNPIGGWEHEIDGGMTYPLGDTAVVSQMLWSVGYGNRVAGFIRQNRPAAAHRILPIQPLSLKDGVAAYRCKTEDGALEITGRTQMQNGVVARTKVTITNTSGDPIEGLSYATMVNFDFADWAHTGGSLDTGERLSIVTDPKSGQCAGLRASGADAVACNDFQILVDMTSAANVSSTVTDGRCNTASAADWRWNSLAPGESVTLTYDMGLGRSTAELRSLLADNSIPADFPKTGNDSAKSIADRYDGAWLACFPPNDLVMPRRRGDGGYDDWALLWGCCMYSGVRGIGAAWESVMDYDRETLRVNWLTSSRTDAAEIRCYAPREGKVELRLLRPATTLIRVPGWLSADKMNCAVDGNPVTPPLSGRYLSFGLLPTGSAVTITFPLERRESHEYIGAEPPFDVYAANGFGEMFAPIEKRGMYTLVWRGDYVESMSHPGVWPVIPGSSKQAR